MRPIMPSTQLNKWSRSDEKNKRKKSLKDISFGTTGQIQNNFKEVLLKILLLVELTISLFFKHKLS